MVNYGKSKTRVFFSCHFVNGKNQDLPIQYHIPKFGLTPYHKLDNVMLPPTMKNLGCTRRSWTHRRRAHKSRETHKLQGT